MNSATNAEAAEAFLEKARKKREEGDVAGASRLAQKAKQLNPGLTPKVDAFISSLNLSRHHSATAKSTTTAGASLSNATSTDSLSDSGPEATPEQLEIITRVLKCSTHYDVFELQKDCDEVLIKKAYKKLVIKVHPDRCRARNADEAFKRVQRAFETLTDPEKRQRYDQFGTDDPQASMTQRRSRGGHNPYAGYYTAGGMDPDDVFMEEVLRMFMGGAANSQYTTRQRRTYHYNEEEDSPRNQSSSSYSPGSSAHASYTQARQQEQRRRTQQQQQQQQQQSSAFLLYNILPFVLFMVIMVLSAVPSSQRSSVPPSICLQQMQQCPYVQVLPDGRAFFVSNTDYDSKYQQEVVRIVNQKYDALEAECERQEQKLQERLDANPDWDERTIEAQKRGAAYSTCRRLEELEQLRQTRTQRAR